MKFACHLIEYKARILKTYQNALNLDKNYTRVTNVAIQHQGKER